MNIILFDGKSHAELRPFTFFRPAACIRCGIFTIAEKWEHRMGEKPSFLVETYLATKYPKLIEPENLLVNGALIPDDLMFEEIFKLKTGQALVSGGTLLAVAIGKEIPENFEVDFNTLFDCCDFEANTLILSHIWDIFRLNGEALEIDFRNITKGRKSAQIPDGCIAKGNVFVEEGAKLGHSILNADGGFIYIGKDSEVMDGSLVRGSLALCEQSVLKLGAKIYGSTTIGPHSKVGGEVNNSVLFGYSNKAHDGFLGNSVLGEWCNIGADSNNSNLKNNYEEVKVWSYSQRSFVKTGLQFCGLFMGDHSKCGINTMFNTGTVVGVSSNIFGSGFPRNFITSFAWGGALGMTEYRLDKAAETARLVMQRRNIPFEGIESDIFTHVYNFTRQYNE
ncbi:MAG: GlmU family protein [Bacteroidetes bacterium]|nr:GlmU family protein [Bacteroidota bacterium]MBU1717962.1 GlmU family protein [Bacteroidota bacterium]